MALHIGKNRSFSTAISDIIDYVKNPEKTDHGKLISCWSCDSRTADAEFLFSKQQYIRKTGRVRDDDVIAYHLRQSFRPGEITPEEANRLGNELAKRFTKSNHAYIVCTHIDKAHIHNHIIWSAVALDETKKFRDFKRSAQAVRNLSDTICIQNGYSIIANPKGKGKSYNKWLGDKKKPSHREILCYAIDDALSKNPRSFEELLKLLQEAGYEIKNGKVPSLLGGNQQRYIRMDTLGDSYAPDVLRQIIKGTRSHKPKKRQVTGVPEMSPCSLLIDIQAKLQEGKGAGYAQWAKSFNLKQASQTMIYLEENGLLDRTVLNERVAEISAHFNELSSKIKSFEQRMAENKIMQQHIINYSRTRNTYIAYRKAGYSKKFLAEHEGDIILHKAAKKYFDEKGIQKLPTIKSLQEEYARLLEEKKSIFPEFKKLKKEKADLQKAKANVDRLLSMKVQPTVADKEHEQR